MATGRTLAAQYGARSNKITAKLITDAIQTLTMFVERLLESIVCFEDMAKTHSGEDLTGCMNDAKAMKANCATHAKAFKVLLDKWGLKKAEEQKEETPDQ